MSKHYTNTREKYSRLADDLKAALECGKQAEEDVTDAGTPNFDAPSLYLPHWYGKEIKQAARLAGTVAFEWTHRDGRAWVFQPDTKGIANRRTVNAEAMTNELRKRGYLATTYYQMD